MSSDLHLLQVEEDLIQLASRPTTPILQSNSSDRNGSSSFNTGISPRHPTNDRSDRKYAQLPSGSICFLSHLLITY